MQDEINEVLRLIEHSIFNRKKLLKGECKFILHTSILHLINNVLDTVENKPTDLILSHAKRRNLECFEQLLNKIPKLIVTQRSIHSTNCIDIRRFKELRHLELVRVQVDKVKGLNALKPQLEFFLCDHCSNIETITKSGKLQWSELVVLKLKNSPVHTEELHFTSMPWIQHLDLSFAKLRELDTLQNLDNLKFLNISFNHLKKLPILSIRARFQLQILLLSHNYLQNLEELQHLPSLRGLDLSWNWISEKRSLSPLLYLKSLQWINMSNTPLSFGKYYRFYLSSAIGSTTAPYQFVIDGKNLSSGEQEVMGSGLGIVRCNRSFYIDSPNDHHRLHNNVIIPSLETVCNKTVAPSTSTFVVKSRSKNGKRGNKVREVAFENEPSFDSEDIANSDTNKEQPSIKENVENENVIVNGANKETQTETVEDVITSVIQEGVPSEQSGEINCENDGDESTNLTANSNLTLGILEVEVHSPKGVESFAGNSPNLEEIEEGKKINIVQISNLPALAVPIAESNLENNSDLVGDSFFANNKKTDDIKMVADEKEVSEPLNENNTSGSDQPGSFKGHCEELINKSENIVENAIILQETEIKTEQITTDNKMKTIKSLITTNSDHSEEICSSTDDQDYFSVTDDKYGNNTLSSIDSGDLTKSHESIDSLENQRDRRTFSTANEEMISENLSSVDTPVNMSPDENVFVGKDPNKMDIGNDSDSDSSGTSDTEYEMWPVQKIHSKTKIGQNILLALLENEIKERSPLSGRTITKWSFDSIQSCVKTKSEPFTVELEFDSAKVENQNRTYIMEFSDAQTLIKKMYDILESRPLSAMNQATYKCLQCDSIFVQDTLDAKTNEVSQVRCTICSSEKVALMEEPRPPENKPSTTAAAATKKPISHSPSQSSIGSAASLEQGHKSGTLPAGMNTPRKYESDIEIISNPSQSSVEVLDEYGRSQAGTPCRKRSSEERQIVAIPQLGTVPELNAHLSTLTESSSSGSLTESVITTYENHNLFNKKPKPEESLIEESREGSPETELASNNITQDTLYEENGNVSLINNTTTSTINNSSIYNYNDFTEVDVRIKLFLYQSIFSDENEELFLLAKCHIWKTGGVDYDACVVFSTTKLYFLSHSFTKFQEEVCDWLTLTDTVLLKDVKKISPIIWHQGAILNLNEINYLILLLDEERTNNFFKCLEGLSLKQFKIQNYVSNKSEMPLQQAILSSEVSHKKVDPMILSFSICLRICINKDDEEEIMRLGGLVITGSEFYLIPGDLSWLCTNVKPIIHVSQQIASLIDVERNENIIKLRFLDEEEALEEIWSIKLATSGQVAFVVDRIKIAWEGMFSVPLEVADK